MGGRHFVRTGRPATHLQAPTSGRHFFPRFFVVVRATGPGVITHSATVTADQPDPSPGNNSGTESNTAVSLATLTLNPTTISGGDAAVGRVTLSSPSPYGGARVTLASSHPEIASVPFPFDVVDFCCDRLWREFYVTTKPVASPVTVQTARRMAS